MSKGLLQSREFVSMASYTTPHKFHKFQPDDLKCQAEVEVRGNAFTPHYYFVVEGVRGEWEP